MIELTMTKDVHTGSDDTSIPAPLTGSQDKPDWAWIRSIIAYVSLSLKHVSCS